MATVATRDLDHDREQLKEAALQAELITGRQETTSRRAWFQIIVRLVRITIGFALLFVGLAMVVLPGPALVVIPASLAILARDFAWAERALLYAQDKAVQAKDKATGRTGTAVLLVSAAALFAFGLWYWKTDQDFACWGITPDRWACGESPS